LAVALERATAQVSMVLVEPVPNEPVGAYTESTTNGSVPLPDWGTQMALTSEVDESRVDASTVTSAPLSFGGSDPDADPDPDEDPLCELPLDASGIGATPSWSAPALPLGCAVPLWALPVVCACPSSPDAVLPVAARSPDDAPFEAASGE
jgi:hypothetical protein